jgi:hypothetical protein
VWIEESDTPEGRSTERSEGEIRATSSDLIVSSQALNGRVIQLFAPSVEPNKPSKFLRRFVLDKVGPINVSTPRMARPWFGTEEPAIEYDRATIWPITSLTDVFCCLEEISDDVLCKVQSRRVRDVSVGRFSARFVL